MTTASLLSKLGIFIVEDFMVPSECDALREEMIHSEKNQAGIYNQAMNAEYISRPLRKTLYCQVSDATHQSFTNRICALKPQLEQFFNIQLAESFEHPKYLHYSKGDFFAPHTDGQLTRKINITINLNDKDTQSTDAGYDGGTLILYGLIKQNAFKNRGIAAPDSIGCLIAYPVDIVHEVTPVISGSRFTIVSRFLSDS